MSLEEKVGQLFINHNNDYSAEYLDGVLDTYHVGGMRYRPGPSAAVQEHIRHAQSRTASRCWWPPTRKAGGNGAATTERSCTHLQAGSHPDKARPAAGQVAGRESRALGCNWAFAPIVDIHYNWRNTVISTRSFGNTPRRCGVGRSLFGGISEAVTDRRCA